MEQLEISKTTPENGNAEDSVRPALALEMEDVDDLDAVLRGYYLSQINSLEKRKDRKLARQLLENHLILPKSRQRTSKDAAYIKEVLEIDPILLERLEEFRLIRRLHKSGANPIFEVSHDTLVEPILAEKRDREAITRFIKRTWKYLILLLLLWFLFGMLFENSFEVLPDLPQQAKRVDIVMDKQVLGIGEKSNSFILPLPPIVIDQNLKPEDSIMIKLPIERIRLSSLGSGDTTGADTIAIQLGSPIEVPLNANDRPVTYQTFSDVVVPLAYTNRDSGNLDAKKVFAKLSGNLKMISTLTAKGIPEGYNNQLEPIELELGDTLVRPGKYAQSVPVSFNLQLSDFFTDENDKNSVKSILGDRPIKLTYMVQVDPAPTPPPPKKAPSVQGIEFKYSDGSTKFISGDAISGTNASENIHIVTEGETLFSIARKYGIVDDRGNTSIESIKKLNSLQGNTLSVGQALRIPVR